MNIENVFFFKKYFPDSKKMDGPWGAVVMGKEIYEHNQHGNTYRFYSIQLTERLRQLTHNFPCVDFGFYIPESRLEGLNYITIKHVRNSLSE